LLLGSLGWGLLHPAGPSPSTLVGKPAPDMTIVALDGSELRLASLKGTAVVVNFWASWCVPCKQEAPILNAAARQYSGRVQLVGVDIQDSESAARSYQADVQSPYPVGPAIAGSYLDWGVTAPPETFFISRRGIVISKVVGPVDRQRLEVYMSQLSP
jgi:cytochrome c biogenesis protein CcmG/thiol:disulfide interchange protein DsbE